MCFVCFVLSSLRVPVSVLVPLVVSGAIAAGCNLFMHCDAAWQGSDEECRRLAEKVLVSTGAKPRLLY